MSTSGGLLRQIGRGRVYVIVAAIWVVLVTVVYVLAGDARETSSGLIAGAEFIAIPGLVGVTRAVWPLRSAGAEADTVVGGGRTYAVHSFTGSSHSVSSQVVSTTSGQGSVNTLPGGIVTGSATIQTTHDRRDQFFLVDGSGRQEAVVLKNAHAAVGEGQLVSAVWGIPPGRKRGPYLLVVNHSTGEVASSGDGLGRVAVGGHPALAAVGVCCLIIAGIMLSVVSGALVVAGFAAALAIPVVSRLRMSRFRTTTSRPLVERLARQAAGFVPYRPTPAAATSGAVAPPPPPAASVPSVPPGWHADPQGRHEHRYWDGHAWTAQVSDAGRVGTDPL